MHTYHTSHHKTWKPYGFSLILDMSICICMPVNGYDDDDDCYGIMNSGVERDNERKLRAMITNGVMMATPPSVEIND